MEIGGGGVLPQKQYFSLMIKPAYGLGSQALLSCKHFHLNTQVGVVGGLDFRGARINPDPTGPPQSFANVLGDGVSL